MTKRFRKKPDTTEVEAVQWDGSEESAREIEAWSEGAMFLRDDDPDYAAVLAYDTMRGQPRCAYVGHWIVRGHQFEDEYSSLSSDEFEANYEPADQGQGGGGLEGRIVAEIARLRRNAEGARKNARETDDDENNKAFLEIAGQSERNALGLEVLLHGDGSTSSTQPVVDLEKLLSDEKVREITKQIVEGSDGEVLSLPYSVVRDAITDVLIPGTEKKGYER